MFKRIVLGLIAILCLGSTAGAQEGANASASANLGLYNALIWRGVTFTNRPVLQFDATLVAPTGKGAVMVGLWTNMEPVAYDSPDEISVLGSQAGSFFTMNGLWAEYDHPVRKRLTAGVGLTRWTYPAANGVAAAFNTTELYGKAMFKTPFSPQVTAVYDVGKIKGLYVEGQVSQSLPLARNLRANAFALAALNSGMGANTKQAEYFAESGLTHTAVGGDLTWTFGAFTVSPKLQLFKNIDDATRIVAPGKTRGVKALFGVSGGWVIGSL